MCVSKSKRTVDLNKQQTVDHYLQNIARISVQSVNYTVLYDVGQCDG